MKRDEILSPGHEAKLIALVEDEHLPDGFRPLVAEADREVHVLQAGCICGWRSSRFTAPPGTRWVDLGIAIFAVYYPQASTLLMRLWRWHLSEPMSSGDETGGGEHHARNPPRRRRPRSRRR